MALQQPLPDEITVKTRAEAKAGYLRSIKIHNPEASLAEGEEPDIRASVFADAAMPLYADAKITGQSATLSGATGQRLVERGEEKGIPRLQATGSTGFGEIEASVGGGTIFVDDELIEPKTQLRFICLQEQLYNDGDPVPIAAHPDNTGPQTNLDPGTVLQWVAPRPGIGPNVVVLEKSDGSGLSGGRELEDEDAWKRRIRQIQANPPTGGNDSQVQLEVERTPGVPVEKCFTFPGLNGPGTMGVTFTVKSETPGASRRPTAEQILTVQAYITGLFPGDFSFFFLSLIDQPVDVVLKIQWSGAAGDWIDAVQWPPYRATGAGAIVVSSSTSATSFILAADNGDYTGVAQPVVGQSFGFYDHARASFWIKRILSFTGTGPWTITCDTTNGASDTSYAPIVGQRAMPWSDALDVVTPAVLAAFGLLGPGEETATFFDEGIRQRRQPESPKFWPNILTTRSLDDVFDLDEVTDGNVVEGGGTTTGIGSFGASAFLIELDRIAVFPL